MNVCKFFFAFYVFINSFNCLKQPYFVWNLLYLSKKMSSTKSETLSIHNLGLREKIWKLVKANSKTNFSAFSQSSYSNFRLKLCQKS